MNIKMFIDSEREKWRLIHLKKSIERFYKDSHDADIMELIDNMKIFGLRPFLGEFTKKYDAFHVVVMREESNGCFWVMHNGNKLFFPRHSSEKGVSTAYMKLCREQDIASPHRYIKDYSVLKDCYFVEAGAAEGSFTLDALINNCKKAYICECNPSWIESLKKTFSKFGDRTELIQKYVADSDTEETITIDSIFKRAVERDGFSFEKDKIFIKMDIEGMEEKGIKGMEYVLKHAKSIECSICAYHNQNDEQMIRSYFPKSEWRIETSPSYMLYPYDKKQMRPYFRRGVIRIKKI